MSTATVGLELDLEKESFINASRLRLNILQSFCVNDKDVRIVVMEMDDATGSAASLN